MTRKHIKRQAGFTPIFDFMIEEYHDLSTAAVFGKIYRFHECKKGVCEASNQTIADELGISKSTAKRAIRLLIEEKWIYSKRAYRKGISGTPRELHLTKKAIAKIKGKNGFANQNRDKFGYYITKEEKERSKKAFEEAMSGPDLFNY